MLAKLLTVVLLLSSVTGFAQSRNEAAARLSALINSSHNTTDISYFKDTSSPDCSAISYSYTLYDTKPDGKSALFVTVTDSYENIPWKNLDYIVRHKTGGMTYLFFKSPITQTRKIVYASDFKDVHQDNVVTRQVNSAGVFLFYKDRYVFEKICFTLKSIDSGQVLPTPVASITSLPVVAYCQKKAPPTKREVETLFVYSITRAKCKQPIDLPGIECYLGTLAGVDMSSIHSDKDFEKQYPVIREYWNHYCYSFSTEKPAGYVWNGETTFLETGNDTHDDNILDLIGYELKGDINSLNPFTGKNYYDNVASDYAKAQHEIETDGVPSTERVEARATEMKNTISALKDAKEFGGKPSDVLLYAYKYDATAHAALIEAIVCNAQGEGIFAGLQDNPPQFLRYMYNVGIRNFSEAVFLFENIYHVKVSEVVKAQVKTNVNGITPVWD